MGINTATVQKLYVAFFNRPADVLGLSFWESKLAGGMTEAQIAQAFAASSEYTSLFTGMNQLQIVSTLYTNLFGRSASLTEANFWAQRMLNGLETVDSIALTLANSAQGTDATAIANKVTASTSFTDSLDTLEEATAYSGLAANAVVRTWLAGVTDTEASLTTATASLSTTVDNIVDNPSNGSTFTLTTTADIGANFTGSSSSDTFIGVVGTDGLSANGTTFGSGDNLTGGGGTDTLSLSISGTNTADQTTASFTLAGIEKISVSNFETSVNASVVDLANVTGLTDITVSSSSANGDTRFTSVKNLVSASLTNGAGDLRIDYAAAAIAGTADAMTLTVQNLSGGTFQADGIETLNITSSTTASTLTGITDSALTTINVSGDAALNIGTLAATVTKVDASGLTAGALTVTGGTAVNYSITGGAGNDVITVSSGFDTSDTINGGSGTDTLSIAATVTAASDLANVTNVEVLKVTGANNVTLASNVAETTFDFSETSAQVLTLNTGYTNATTVKLTGNTAAGGADKVVNSANVALTVNADAADLDADITITGGTGNDTINLTADNDGTGSVLTNISGVETITVAANTTTATHDIIISMGANDTQIAAGKTLAVDASALTNSGATLKFVGTTSETDGFLSVTGGAGNDSITGSASGKDTLIGGAGNDAITLTTLASTNVVTGGSGTDTLTVTTDITAASAFTGVTGVETLILGSSTDLTVASSLSATGITSINIADTSANVVTLNSGYTGDTTIVMNGNTAAGGADKVVNSANVALTVKANAADLDADITITGGTGNDTIVLTADNDGTGSVLTNVSGVETITVAANTTTATHDIVISMGANNTQIAAGKTLKVDASALTDSGATLKFVGVTNETDGFLSVTGGAGADSITGGASGFDTLIGGAGNDAFTLTTLATTNVVTGGSGTDTLTVTTDITAASALSGVTGVETLILGASTDLTMASSISATGITTINTANTSANVVTLSAGYTGDTTIDMTGNTAAGGADTVTNTANVALTVKANAADLDADITITGGTGTDTIILTADNDGTGAVLTNISGVETITVAANTATATHDIVITMGAVDTQIASGKTLTVNASALTNSGATLKFVGTTSETDGHLSIVGGAGADSITGSGSTDTITGGSGADTITIVAPSTKFLYDTFTDAATGDILNTADKGTETFTSTKISLASQATFSDYLDAAAAGDGSTNGIYRWFTFGGNTYVVEDISAGASFVSGTDRVIELTGTLDISGSTVGDHILTLSLA